jgi:hypothetical protein
MLAHMSSHRSVCYAKVTSLLLPSLRLFFYFSFFFFFLFFFACRLSTSPGACVYETQGGGVQRT